MLTSQALLIYKEVLFNTSSRGAGKKEKESHLTGQYLSGKPTPGMFYKLGASGP